MITLLALARAIAASTGSPLLTLTYSSFSPPPVRLKRAKSTLASERFIPRHMMMVRIMPAAPTSEPLMISRLL